MQLILRNLWPGRANGRFSKPLDGGADLSDTPAIIS